MQSSYISSTLMSRQQILIGFHLILNNISIDRQKKTNHYIAVGQSTSSRMSLISRPTIFLLSQLSLSDKSQSCLTCKPNIHITFKKSEYISRQQCVSLCIQCSFKDKKRFSQELKLTWTVVHIFAK